MPSSITKDTWVSVGLVIAIIGATAWVSTTLASIRAEQKAAILLIQRVDERVAKVDRKLDDAISNRWTAGDMRRWTDLLRVANHELGLDVPDPAPSTDWRRIP